MTRGRRAYNFNFEDLYNELKKNGWNRAETGYSLGVSSTTISNYIRKMRHVGYEIPNADDCKAKPKVKDYDGVRGIPTNEERLRYLDNPTVRG